MSSIQRLMAISAVIFLCGCKGGTDTDSTPAVSPTQATTIELDHVFTFAPQESSETQVIQVLHEAGLTVDDERSEFPDGVMGRYVHFENAYFEVLWLQPNSNTESDTKQKAMWQTTKVSPFGVGMRWRKDAPKELPFESRSEAAEWMRPGTEMRILTGENETLAPSLFVVPDYMAMPSWSTGTDETENGSGLQSRNLTKVRLTTLPAGYPEIAEALTSAGVQIQRGDEPLMELFIGESDWQIQKDLRPVLPVIIWY